MQKIIMPLCIIVSMAIQANDLVKKHTPDREMFVYALDTFIKHDSHHGIAKLAGQVHALKETDGSVRLSRGTKSYIKGVRDRLIERNQADKIRLIAPFLLESGISFIDELGDATSHYQETCNNRVRNEYQEEEAYRTYHEMRKRRYEIQAVMERPGVIGADLILSNKNYIPKNGFLKRYFSSFSPDMQAEILQAAERDYCKICQQSESAQSTAYGQEACKNFQENLEGLKEWHAASKEQEAASAAGNVNPGEQSVAQATAFAEFAPASTEGK